MAESQWGRLNAGQVYGILATDVDRALACANLRDYEAILIQHIREHSWGTSARRKRRGEPWPDARPFRPDLASLAREIGAPLPRLSEAKARLIRSRMLVETPEGLSLNKTATEWLDPSDPSKPRIDPARLAYAARGWDQHPNTPKPPIFGGESEAETNPENATSQLRETVSEVTPNRKSELRETVTRGYAKPYPRLRETVSEVTPNRNLAYIENARVLDPTGLDPTGVERPKTHAGACEAGGAASRDDEPFIPPTVSMPPLATTPEFDRVSAKAGRCGAEWYDWARSKAEPHGDYPPFWVWTVLERKVEGLPGRQRVSLQVATSILQRWARGEGNDIPPDRWPDREGRATGTDQRPRASPFRKPNFGAMKRAPEEGQE